MPKNEGDIRGEKLRDLAVKVHEMIVDTMGTTKGTRYDADLERAEGINELAEMVATLHPFVDGNRRTAFTIWCLGQDRFKWEDITITDIRRVIEKYRGWLDILAKI